MATRYAPLLSYGHPIDGEPPLENVSEGFMALRFFTFSPRLNTWAYAFHVSESMVLNETGGIVANQLMLHGSKCTRGRTTPDFKFLVDEEFLRVAQPFLPLSHDIIFRALVYVKPTLLYRIIPKISSLFALNNNGKYRAVRCSTSREYQDCTKPYRIFLKGLAIDQVEVDWQAADVLLNKRMLAFYSSLPDIKIKRHTDITQAVRNMQALEMTNVAGCAVFPRTITATLVTLCGPNINERRFLQALIGGTFANKTVEACMQLLGPLAERVRAIESMHAVFQQPAPMQDASDNQLMISLMNAMLSPIPERSLNTCFTAQFGTNADVWRERSFFDYSIYAGAEFRVLFYPKPLDFTVKTELALRHAPPGVYFDKDDDCFFIKSNTSYYLFVKHGKIAETVSIDLPNEMLMKTDLIWLTPNNKLSIDFCAFFTDLHLQYAYFDSDEAWEWAGIKRAFSITDKPHFIFAERDCETSKVFKTTYLKKYLKR